MSSAKDERQDERADERADDRAVVDDALRALPVAPLPRELEARVRRLARAELAASGEPAWRRAVVRGWNQVALPACIAVMAVGYLHWAVGVVSALHH